MMNGIIILCLLILSTRSSDIDLDEEFPDINDLFVIEEKKDNHIRNIPGVFVKNIVVDIEKLNLTKFVQKLDTYKGKLNVGATKPRTKVAQIDLAELGIQLNDTRRQVIRWDGDTLAFKQASFHMTKQKALDLILQLIYMARHKLRELESCKYFSRTDTGYRIAFVYRHLRRIFKRMMDIYAIMYKNKTKWFHQDWHLQLHTKATKLHVDFLYLWWVLIRLDEKYSIKQGIRSRVPKWMSSKRPTTTRTPPPSG
ncbi:uncharacterized protein LOC119189405 [Manduca sexta]|uniref:uncharacterized protein LOC119189405 n=1 Tax=Manduca sexta TaxID=7130 RepID=UPI00188E02FB|nr:uncharacterized protein LOC119189405 [Manduca sexta]